MRKIMRAGFTLVEIIIAVGISSMVILAAMEIFLKVISNDDSVRRKQGVKIDLPVVMGDIAANLFNAVRIDPRENLMAAGDSLYKGIYGMNATQPVMGCKYLSQNGLEQLSVIRVTSLLGKNITERLLRPWAEVTLSGAQEKLLITYHLGAEYPFQVDAGGKVIFPNEIYMIDGDFLASRRYKVLSASHIVTNKDPYTGLPVSGTTFTYTELSLGMPDQLDGLSQLPGRAKFISGSTVYISKTIDYCVSDASGQLIVRDENTKNITVLYDASKDGYQISAFKVGFHQSKSGVQIVPSVFQSFPITITDIECVNTAQVTLELLEKNATNLNAVPVKTQRQILLNNYNDRRPANCL